MRLIDLCRGVVQAIFNVPPAKPVRSGGWSIEYHKVLSPTLKAFMASKGDKAVHGPVLILCNRPQLVIVELTEFGKYLVPSLEN